MTPGAWSPPGSSTGGPWTATSRHADRVPRAPESPIDTITAPPEPAPHGRPPIPPPSTPGLPDRSRPPRHRLLPHQHFWRGHRNGPPAPVRTSEQPRRHVVAASPPPRPTNRVQDAPDDRPDHSRRGDARLRAVLRPRAAPRSLQRHRRSPPDRLDRQPEPRRHPEPGALQLLQRLQLHAADHRLLLHRLEGQRRQHRRNPRVRVEPRHPPAGRADERECCHHRPRGRRIRAGRPDPDAEPPGRRAAGRRKPGRVRVPGCCSRSNCTTSRATPCRPGSPWARWWRSISTAA